ncbi:MAG: branched-chain amino acid ABC transporter permease [Anaerorhabdus sp.]
MKKINKESLLYPVLLSFAIFVLLSLLMMFDVLGRYETGIIISICINIILVISLNITTGFLGQLTLGHAGFMAVGAYGSAYLLKEVLNFLPSSIGFVIALILGGLLAMFFGIVIGVPTLRLKGDYLAIITLAFGEVIRTILLNLKIVGGAKGYTGISRLTNFNNVFIIMIISSVLMILLIRSRHGRAIISVREDEIAAEASGINTAYFKILAFVTAAFFAGVAGGLYAHYMGILEPRTFGFNKSIEILVMVVLGGMGNIKGGIISAIILTLLPELLRDAASYRTLIYALVLIVMMLFKNNPMWMYHIKEFFKFKRKEKVV